MRKSLALSLMVAMIAVPALTACKSSRTSNRRRASKASKGRLVASTPTPPPAPDLAPPAYMDPGPSMAGGGFAPDGTTYYDQGSGFGDTSTLAHSDGFAAPEYGMPSPMANTGALQVELEAARAEATRLADERDALSVAVSQAQASANEAREALIGAPPAGAGAGAGPLVAGGEQVPVEDALRSLESDLRLSGSGAEVLREGSSVIVRLTDVFAPGRDTLRGDARASQALSATAQALARYPGARVSVVGHSDSTPIVKTKHLWRSNQHLSEARARTVANMLGQVGDSRVAVEGRGASQPIIANERTRQDRARNRRVDIVISL